jgi:hypothetical protein
MGFAQWMRVLDTIGGLVQLTGRMRRGEDASGLQASGAPAGALGQIEARLAGVVVAALKEAFDRDSTRLELERSQIEAERQRAEAALQAELRRQAADRALGQLRLVAVMAIGVWALSAALGVWLPGMREGLPRILLGVGWLFSIGALGLAFAGWQHISTWSTDGRSVPFVSPEPGAGAFAPWLLLLGLALTGASLLTAL